MGKGKSPDGRRGGRGYDTGKVVAAGGGRFTYAVAGFVYVNGGRYLPMQKEEKM